MFKKSFIVLIFCSMFLSLIQVVNIFGEELFSLDKDSDSISRVLFSLSNVIEDDNEKYEPVSKGEISKKEHYSLELRSEPNVSLVKSSNEPETDKGFDGNTSDIKENPNRNSTPDNFLEKSNE